IIKTNESKNLNNKFQNKLRKDIGSVSSFGCFMCGKIGHVKVDCPQKEKAFQATWGESVVESRKSESVEGIFMAIEDLSDEEIQTTTSSKVVSLTDVV
ncbi:hypothetical protein LINGRAHAP2_LOCUS3934, partial [Linum grandiflorum]